MKQNLRCPTGARPAFYPVKKPQCRPSTSKSLPCLTGNVDIVDRRDKHICADVVLTQCAVCKANRDSTARCNKDPVPLVVFQREFGYLCHLFRAERNVGEPAFPMRLAREINQIRDICVVSNDPEIQRTSRNASIKLIHQRTPHWLHFRWISFPHDKSILILNRLKT